MPGLRMLKEAVNDSPVLTQEDARTLGHKVLQMSSADTVEIEILHTVRQITRITNNRVLAGDDGGELRITVTTGVGTKGEASLNTNQLDDTTLQAVVARAEGAARSLIGGLYTLYRVPDGPQQYLPVDLWRPATIAALATRSTAITDMIDTVQSAGLVASGFVGIVAQSAFVMNKDGLETYYRETDTECTMAARTKDGTSSGWHGQANRDWSKVDPHFVAATAVDVARRGANPKAVEPGRRTAILSPLAVVQLVHLMSLAYDAFQTDNGNTPFSKRPTGNKLGQLVFDRRITISSDPNDPEGGYRPDFGHGMPEPKMTWVENGVLTNLAYNPDYGMGMGKPYAGIPWSFRMSGGDTTIDQMIAQCKEGVLVNRISNLEQADEHNGTVTGLTRDGTFFIKDGKIDTPIRNYRFTDSPWFVLNQIIAMGPPVRAAFGYTPPSESEGYRDQTSWPRRPIIVPPLMVRDFNFTSLADAV